MGRLDALNDMVGTTYTSKSYGRFIVTGFESYRKVYVEFLDTGYKTSARAQCVKRGSVKDPYFPSIYGIGYLGEGTYTSTYNRKGVTEVTKAYSIWMSRLSACYNPKNNRAHNYASIQVCKEWHNFQNFAKWYYDQVRLYGKDGHVDKDLLFLGNSLYSPDTCCYIPNSINCLFVGNKGSLITGASYCASKKKWLAQLQEGSINRKGTRTPTRLGQFDTKEDAVDAYVKAKVVKIRQECVKHQDAIPANLFYKLYTGAENYVDYYMNHKGETE